MSGEVIGFSFQENEQGDWWLSLIRALGKALITAAAGRCFGSPFNQDDPKKLSESLPGGEEPNQQPLHFAFKPPLPLPQTPN